jgi:GNAT superfamily N-acetyltransferase
MNAVIRPVAPQHRAAWLPLWRGYLEFYRADLPEAATETLWTRLNDPAEPVHGALSWEGDAAIGLAHWLPHRNTWAAADVCYLNDLYVLKSSRGGGIGRRLIEHVYAWAAAAGCDRVYWLTHETNAVAQVLYNQVADRTGFIHYGHRLP